MMMFKEVLDSILDNYVNRQISYKYLIFDKSLVKNLIECCDKCVNHTETRDLYSNWEPSLHQRYDEELINLYKKRISYDIRLLEEILDSPYFDVFFDNLADKEMHYQHLKIKFHSICVSIYSLTDFCFGLTKNSE